MLYRYLSSLKTSVYILVLMGIIFLIGTIFPQGENIEDYISAGGKYIAVVRALERHLADLVLASKTELPIRTWSREGAVRSVLHVGPDVAAELADKQDVFPVLVGNGLAQNFFR